MKPRLIKVKFKDEHSDTVLVDIQQTVKQLIASLAQKIELLPHHIADYGLYMDQEDGTGIWLEEDSKIKQCKIGESVRIVDFGVDLSDRAQIYLAASTIDSGADGWQQANI